MTAFVRPHAAAVVSIAALVILVYRQTVTFDFVNWDDPWYVLHNPLITSWHPSNLYRIATSVVTRNYAPLTIFSFLIDHSLWGLWPGGYHLTNVGLHLINAVLVYVLLLRLTGNRFIAWTTAALFAVHPVHVESVAWISSRKGLLSATFILSALICRLRPERTARQEGFWLLFLAMALLSKAIAVVVPAVALAYDLLILRRPVSRAVSEQIVPGFLAVMLLLVTMSAQTTQTGGVRGHLGMNKAQILAVDTVIVWRYVGMLAHPRDLCVLYDPPTAGIGGLIAAAVAGWLLVGTAVYRYRRRLPLVTFGVVAFFLFLLPVLNLFPLTTMMNDRYLYLPSIAFFAVVAFGLSVLWSGICRLGKSLGRMTEREPRRMTSAATIAVGFVVGELLLASVHLSAEQLPVWRNGLALWQHADRHVPELPVVQIQLANTLHSLGRKRQAVTVLNRALRETAPDAIDRRRMLEKLKTWRQ